VRGDGWSVVCATNKSSFDMEPYLLQPRSYNTSAGAAGVADGTYRLAGDYHNEIPSMYMKPTAAIAAWRQL
jgi:hypothetical protein